MSLLYFNYFRLYCFYYEEFAVKQYATVSWQQPPTSQSYRVSSLHHFLLCLIQSGVAMYRSIVQRPAA